MLSHHTYFQQQEPISSLKTAYVVCKLFHMNKLSFQIDFLGVIKDVTEDRFEPNVARIYCIDSGVD